MKSPTDAEHSYRVRFPDGLEAPLKRSEVLMLARFKAGEISDSAFNAAFETTRLPERPGYERANAFLISAPWAEVQPGAKAMADCSQDSEWHAEGDVWTHTRMVVAEAERLPEWPSLDRDAQLLSPASEKTPFSTERAYNTS